MPKSTFTPRLQKNSASEMQLPTAKFNPLVSFKDSFVEAMQSSAQKTNTVSTSRGRNTSIPSLEYMQKKRTSVFVPPVATQNDIEKFEPPVYPKSKEQEEKIIEILKNNFLTKKLSAEGLKTIAKAMYLKKYEPEQNIITYGDIG
mmetsp:Transcript_45478/g.33250  ORF Transcript_45478/g.33250 Transcript_45478/m.33250 type:complete len:145 (+) Transcript_45478:365-799(+)|eukprot:CAMPEP_0202962528 /NCGR_PEP_ID=MMETSP1396-20130829/6635_1 /ASSEMBLY_ACC=CAM_ASM_000872 /TAXON_ID= /ORGANISM="Pseudokeronopsis sp., Strain Brazil" /LENGTH=144 /DNA_ID=CAMNT_0049683179 /DNA_START=356 /DNA_END=790 /DNA_ORIENTATION=+